MLKTFVTSGGTIGLGAAASALVVSVCERLAMSWTSDGPSVLGIEAWATLLAANAFFAATVLVVAALLSPLGRRAGRRWALLAATLFGLAAGGASFGLGRDLATGGWISQQSWGWLVAYVPAAAAVGVAAVAWLVWFGVRQSPRAKLRGALGGAFLVASVVTVFIDHMVLPGLYPGIHLWLWGAAVGAGALGAHLLIGSATSRWAVVPGVVLLVASLAGPAPWFLARMSTRAALTMSAPMAANLVRETLPPIEFQFAERDLATIDANAGKLERDARGDLDRTDWNVLWITVDTLRADALWPVRTKSTSFVSEKDVRFVDGWLKKTVVFERAYAQAPATHRSMPQMFRSVEAHESALKLGEPIADAMSSTGRVSSAIVNNFFLEPRYLRSQSLLWGFDHVEVHEKSDQHLVPEQFETVLDRVGDEKFFVWLHFYCLHHPGYDNGKQLPENMNWRKGYRQSLRWFDGEFEKIIRTLVARGLNDNTIVVFSSDHGEGLGDHRQKFHGPNIFDEAVRVPLAIWIPGATPRVVKQTAGNVDIVPTLWAALGLDPAPTHRGRSLLPAVHGEALPARPYYVENFNGTKKGVVVEQQKLIFDEKANTFLRFDLAQDPGEKENLFADGPDDQPLLAALYRKNPELVKMTPVAKNLVANKLADVDAESPGADFPYLAALGARSKTGAAEDELARIFEKAEDDKVRFVALRGLMELDAGRAQDVVEAYLPRAVGEARRKFVNGLADLDLHPIDAGVVDATLDPHADDAMLYAWLRWLRKWKAPPFGAKLLAIADRSVDLSPATVANLAAVLGTAKLSAAEEKRAGEFLAKSLDHPATRIRYEAIGALTARDDARALKKLYDILKTGSLRDKQAAMHALAKLDPDEAIPAIVEAGSDLNLVLDAVEAITESGNAEGLPFLRDVQKNHYNRLIRERAEDAIKELE